MTYIPLFVEVRSESNYCLFSDFLANITLFEHICTDQVEDHGFCEEKEQLRSPQNLSGHPVDRLADELYLIVNDKRVDREAEHLPGEPLGYRADRLIVCRLIQGLTMDRDRVMDCASYFS